MLARLNSTQLIPSHLSSHLIPSDPISSHPIPSHLIPSHSIPSLNSPHRTHYPERKGRGLRLDLEKRQKLSLNYTLRSKFEFSFVALIHFLQKRGEKLTKYQANSSCVIMSVILMTTLFYKALIIIRRNLMLITLRA